MDQGALKHDAAILCLHPGKFSIEIPLERVFQQEVKRGKRHPVHLGLPLPLKNETRRLQFKFPIVVLDALASQERLRLAVSTPLPHGGARQQLKGGLLTLPQDDIDKHLVFTVGAPHTLG